MYNFKWAFGIQGKKLLVNMDNFLKPLIQWKSEYKTVL